MFKKKKLIFRVDVSNRIGTGHIVRCLELAKIFKKYFKIIILTKTKDIYLWNLKSFRVLFYPKRLIKNFYLRHQGNLNYVFLFDLNKKFISKMEQKLISKIENRKAIFAENNFLQNKNNLFIAPYQLKKKFFHSKKNVLLGPKFCIFKKELIKTAKMKKNPKKIISVCMGGSDPKNLTLKVVLHLLKINNFEDYKFIFIVGKLYKKRNFFLLKKICQKKNNFKIVRDPKNIYKIFFQSKIAIINSGNLKYELSALKVPFILLSNEKKSHFYNQLFAKKFYCFFNTNINDQIKNIEPILKKTFKSKKILPNFTKNNFHKVDLNSKFVLVKKVTKFYNEKK